MSTFIQKALFLKRSDVGFIPRSYSFGVQNTGDGNATLNDGTLEGTITLLPGESINMSARPGCHYPQLEYDAESTVIIITANLLDGAFFPG